MSNIKKYLETFGRLGVVLTLAVIMNRTQWYQNLPLQTLSNANFYVWAISTGFALCLIWILIPIVYSQNVQKASEESGE